MILILFLYIADVFAQEKESLRQMQRDSYEIELPTGDPVHQNYDISEFWWEDATTEWQPWWLKENVTIPPPWKDLPSTTNKEGETTKKASDVENETTVVTSKGENKSTEEISKGENKNTVETSKGEKETTVEISKGEKETSVEISKGENKTTVEISKGEKETTVEISKGENMTTVDISKEDKETTLDITETNKEMTQTEITTQNETISTTSLEHFIRSSTEGQTGTDLLLPAINDPAINDPALVAQLRAHYGLADAPAPIVSDIPLNYEYGELQDKIPENLRGPDYPDLSPDIPVIRKGTDDNYEENIPGILGQDKASPQPKTSFDNKYPWKSTASGSNSLRSMDYPSLYDVPAVPVSIEQGLDAYSPIPFKFDKKNYEQELMALTSRDGGMNKQPTTTKEVAHVALSPTYTVPYIETNETSKSISTSFTEEPSTITSFTYTTEPITTTGYTKPTTTIEYRTEPTTTIEYKTEPTTTIEYKTEPTTTIEYKTEPTTTTEYKTEPTTTTEYTTKRSLEPTSPLPKYLQTYKVDSSWLNSGTLLPTPRPIRPEIITTTTSHPVVENLKKEMADQQVGYFSVCLKKFFQIFSDKENYALKNLLKGASHAFEKINKNDILMGLGEPMWPGAELGFLQMRLAPIAIVKSRALVAYQFYSSGSAFDIKSLHERVDNIYHTKDGENLMKAIALFNDYPGRTRMNAEEVMENLFRAILAPYLRDTKSKRVLSVLREINEKLKIAQHTLFEDGRRNTQSNWKYTSITNYHLKSKINKSDYNEKRNNNDTNYDDSNYTFELASDSGDNNNAVERKAVIDETKTIYDSNEFKTVIDESDEIISDSNTKSKKKKVYDDDTYVRMSKVKDKEPEDKHSTTDSGQKEKNTKKLNCSDYECNSDKSTVPETASKNKYDLNKARYRNGESKVKLLKETSDKTRHGEIGHQKETEMGLSVKSRTKILYHYDKNGSQKPKKYSMRYKNYKIATKSSESDLDKGKRKDTEKTTYTHHAKNGDSNYKKWYLEILKYKKSEPKPYYENKNKIDNINSNHKINRKTKYVSPTQKLNCYDNDDECSDISDVPKTATRNNYVQNEKGYENAERKIKSLKDTKYKTSGKFGYHKEAQIDYSVAYKVNEAINFHDHTKEPKLYQFLFKKAKKVTGSSSLKYDNGLSKDDKIKKKSYEYYARNGETDDKKWYLKPFDHKKTQPKPYDEKDSKIGYINGNDKINIKNKYVHAEEELQAKRTKTKDISKTKTLSKNNGFDHKTAKKVYYYESNDYETESKSIDKKENKISINRKKELSETKDDDYDTFSDSVDSKEMIHSKTTKNHRIYEPKNENANSLKAKDYFKERRIRRTTKGKEYFREIKQYYKMPGRNHDVTSVEDTQKTRRDAKNIDNTYLRHKTHETSSNSKKDYLSQKSATNVSENEMIPFGNSKKILEDGNAREAKNTKNTYYADSGNSFENESKNKHQERNLDQQDLNIKVKRTKSVAVTKRSKTILQKHYKQKQKKKAKYNERHFNMSQSSIHEDVYSDAPAVNKKYEDLQNKRYRQIDSENNTNKLDNDIDKKIWQHSKSQYIENDNSYIKERFLDFNRDSKKTKPKHNLRNSDINKNVLRDESSYSDKEEILRTNLQDNLIHAGKKFTDTLLKYEKYNAIRDISSSSDEENTLKKNIYKLFA